MEQKLTLGESLFLFVEDDPGWRLILKHIVESLQVNAIYAESAESALEIIKGRNDVTCMFLDMSLGVGISGADLAEQIKSQPGYRDTPLIAMTAHEKEKISGFEKGGFTGYIQKPISIDDLGIIIEAQYAQA